MTEIILDKSPIDNSEYVMYELPNSLKVLIIKDSDIDSAAVSMRVNVGFGEDDDDIPGVAHLLEHMLFNGTKKYPNENQFKNFISEHNGYSNASTSLTRTEYHFTISPDAILDSLEIFGDFFIRPILSDDCIGRELKAVNSEHEKNILNDGRIEFMVMKEGAEDSNPYKKFGTGCNQTLDRPDIGNHVRDFFNKYYSSDIMTLCVISKHDISTIKDIIGKIYSEIPNKGIRSYLNKRPYDLPYIAPNKQFLYKVVPVKSEYHLKLYWSIVDQPNPKTSAYGFISHLLGNEVKNTIHHILYGKKYIKRLSSSAGISNDSFRLFGIHIELTELGFENWKSIVDLIYAYIQMLKNNISNPHMALLHENIRSLNIYSTDYFIKSSPLDRIMMISDYLNESRIDPKQILIINKLDCSYADEEYIENFKSALDMLNPTNCSIMLKSPTYDQDICPNTIEFYPGSKYSIEPFMYEPSDHDINNIITELELPPTNDYISTSTKMIDQNMTKPEIIDSDRALIFALYTNKFKTPDAIIDLDIYLRTYTELSNLSRIGFLMYLNTILSLKNDELYQLQTSYGISINMGSFLKFGLLRVQIFGNYGKIDLVLSKLLDLLKTDLKSLNETSMKNSAESKIASCFAVQKDLIKSNAFNSKKLSPYEQLEILSSKYFYKHYIDRDILLENIDQIRLEDILSLPNPLNDISVRLFMSGNISSKLAESVLKLVESVSGSKPSYDVEFVKTPNPDPTNPDLTNSNIQIEPNHNKQDLNNVISLCVPILSTNSIPDASYYKNIAYLNVLDNIISPHFFDTLRTKETYGYIVSSHIKHIGINYERRKYYSFLIQSTVQTSDIIERIKKYIEPNISAEQSSNEPTNLADVLSTLTESGLSNTLNALIDELSDNKSSLSDYVAHLEYIWILCDQLRESRIMEDIYNEFKSDINKFKTDIIRFYQDRFSKTEEIIIFGYKTNTLENKKIYTP